MVTKRGVMVHVVTLRSVWFVVFPRFPHVNLNMYQLTVCNQMEGSQEVTMLPGTDIVFPAEM